MEAPGVFALDDATDAKDVTVMKELLAQYRREFSEDQWQLQDGYAVIIDCLEHPDPGRRNRTVGLLSAIS